MKIGVTYLFTHDPFEGSVDRVNGAGSFFFFCQQAYR
jgi:hypothetical protein